MTLAAFRDFFLSGFRLGGLAALALLVLPVVSCRAFFWRDTKSALVVRWQDSRISYEPVLHFESKTSLSPWHGNAITRNYKTEILRHELSGSKWQTRSLGTILGWTLEGTLFAVKDRLVFIRGRSDNLGTLPNREVVLSSTDRIDEANIRTIQSKRFILLAIPSPDGKGIVVFSTNSTVEKPGLDLYAEFYRFEAAGATSKPERISEQRLTWEGVPGMPLAAWKNDSSGVYVHRTSDVLWVTFDSASIAKEFPKCFRATHFAGESSLAGFRLFRDPSLGIEDGLPRLRLEKGAPQLPFSGGPMIRDASRISPGCEKP